MIKKLGQPQWLPYIRNFLATEAVAMLNYCCRQIDPLSIAR